MRRLLKVGQDVWGLVVLAAIGIAFIFIIGRLQQRPESPSLTLQSPIMLSPTQAGLASPLPTPTVVPVSISECQFTSSANSEVIETPLNAYTFSDPEVVLAGKSAIRVFDWLPDSKRLVIARGIPNSLNEQVGIFDMDTKEFQQFGERYSVDARPIWIESNRAIVYADYEAKQWVLRISQGNPQTAQLLTRGLASKFLAADPTGQDMLYMIDRQLQRLNTASLMSRTVGVDLGALEYAVPLEPGRQPGMYQTAWRPGSTQVAIYSNVYFFLVDVENAQSCRIDLGHVAEAGKLSRWAGMAQWSPDGRYLAMLTTAGVPPVSFTDLSILDATTGQMRSLHPEAPLESGQYYVMSTAWSPNSRQLVILGAVRRDSTGFQYDGLFLLDARSGSWERILPQYEFGEGDWGTGIDWSADGKQIVLNCPTQNEGRVCLITVTAR
ncbi:MAG: hypothetical protein HY870_06785 [Chloroflexi bacterium]|nr:hypothetical protein [Chloroflexota bacterium]